MGSGAAVTTTTVLTSFNVRMLIEPDKMMRSKAAMAEKAINPLGIGTGGSNYYFSCYTWDQAVYSYLCWQRRSPQHSFWWTISGRGSNPAAASWSSARLIYSGSQQAEINPVKICMAKTLFLLWVFLVYFAAFATSVPQVARYNLLSLASDNH